MTTHGIGGPVMMGSLEQNALAMGWEVVEYRGEPSRPRVLIECIECGARIERRWSTVYRASVSPCAHPSCDEQRSYLEDGPTRVLVRDIGPMTLAEIGDAMGGITREAVRLIEAAAMAKLRRACVREGLSAEDAAELFAWLDSQRPQDRDQYAPGHIPRRDGRDPSKLAEYRERYLAKKGGVM